MPLTCFLDKSGMTKTSQSPAGKLNPVFIIGRSTLWADTEVLSICSLWRCCFLVTFCASSPMLQCASFSSRASCVWGRWLSEKRWWWYLCCRRHCLGRSWSSHWWWWRSPEMLCSFPGWWRSSPWQAWTSPSLWWCCPVLRPSSPRWSWCCPLGRRSSSWPRFDSGVRGSHSVKHRTLMQHALLCKPSVVIVASVTIQKRPEC